MSRFGVLAVALVVGVFGPVPVAHADESMYLQQIRQPNKLFVSVTNAQLLRLGYVACDSIRVNMNNGMSMASARNQADQAVASSATGELGLSYIDRASVMHITEEAEHNLC